MPHISVLKPEEASLEVKVIYEEFKLRQERQRVARRGHSLKLNARLVMVGNAVSEVKAFNSPGFL